MFLAAACSRDSNREGDSDSGPVAITDACVPVPATREEAGVDAGYRCAQPAATSACDAEMCFIPHGCFMMGEPADELFAAATASVSIEVRLTHDFLMGKTEVTRRQWTALGLPEPIVDWTLTGSSSADEPPDGYASCHDPECPIVWIGFEDALAYANLRSEREGLRPCYLLRECYRAPGEQLRCLHVETDAASPYECEGYRLPTEAEWEYAARAGTTSAFYSGEIDPDRSVSDDCGLDVALDAIGWYCGNSGAPPGRNGGRPHPVAQKRANDFGLFDMSGNAYEWVNDLFTPEGYGASPATDPVYGLFDPRKLTPLEHPSLDNRNEVDGWLGDRVVRSGAFDLWSMAAKSGRRIWLGGPGGQSSGFRLTRTVFEAARGSR